MSEVTLKILNEFVTELDKKRINYIIIAGFGLDGKRGHLSRPHQDADILCLKTDLLKLDEIILKLGYSGQKYNDLYKISRDDGSKVDLGLVTLEGEEAVTYGRIAITRFPKQLFENPQKGKIENYEFNIAPNELLKTWGAYSKKGNDAEYAKTLPADEKLIKKIKRVLRDNSV